MRCLGCDKEVPWDGRGLFAYTCPCGGHVWEADGGLFIPASLSRCLSAMHQPGVKPSDVDIPHLDYLVGTSLHTSLLKTMFVEMVTALGAKWMKDCEKCQKDGTLRKEQEREAHLAVLEVQRILGRSK